MTKLIRIVLRCTLIALVIVTGAVCLAGFYAACPSRRPAVRGLARRAAGNYAIHIGLI